MAVILISPAGNREVVSDNFAETRLAAGYQTLADYEAAWQQQEQVALAEWNASPASLELRFERLRAERDRRLAKTDFLLMPDYPLSQQTREEVQAYRQALRDLPSQPAAPWDGGGALTPWPAQGWLA